MIETTSHGIDADDPLLVWGGGAMSGTMAAYWVRVGLPIRVMVIAVDHARARSGPGLQVHGPVDDFVQRVDARTPDALRGRYSLIVLAVKTQDTEAAAASLEPHLRRDGFVLPAQIGLDDIALSRILGADRVCVTSCTSVPTGMGLVTPVRQPWCRRRRRNRRPQTPAHA